MGKDRWPFFSYKGETCITGMVLALAAYYGVAGEGSDAVVDWLLGEQLEDGGWNCATVRGSTRSSFNTTILALEGLLEYENSRGVGSTRWVPPGRGVTSTSWPDGCSARRTGEVISASWTRFSFPPRWHYDVLRGLDYLRSAGASPDERMDEAIALVESKRSKDGRWPLQNHHRGRSTSSWNRGQVSQVAGTRCVPCASSTGSAGPTERQTGPLWQHR